MKKKFKLSYLHCLTRNILIGIEDLNLLGKECVAL